MTRRVATRLRRGEADPLSARETLYAILRRSVGAAFRREESYRYAASRPATRRARTEIAEQAKEELTLGLGEPISLDSLANTLHTSPYHLARTFRAETGYSVHGYLTQLRLRTAWERLSGNRGIEVGRLASDLGFSSPSHFTAAFRQAFGAAPSGINSTRRAEAAS